MRWTNPPSRRSSASPTSRPLIFSSAPAANIASAISCSGRSPTRNFISPTLFGPTWTRRNWRVHWTTTPTASGASAAPARRSPRPPDLGSVPMLKQRVLTALVLAPLIVALVFLTSTPVFAALLGVIFLAGLWEWTRMSGMRKRPLRACLLLGYAIVMALLWPVVRSPWWWLPTLAGFAWWLLAFAWLRHVSFGASPTRGHIALKLLAGLLVVVPAWCAVVALHGGQTIHVP